MGRKLTADEEENLQNQLAGLVEVNTMGAIVKKAWEQVMKQPAEDTIVELDSGEKTTLQEMLDLWDGGQITPEMKETMSSIVNVPKIQKKLDRITYGQFTAAVGKKLSSSLNKIKAEQERRRKLERAEEERNAQVIQPAPELPFVPKPRPAPQPEIIDDTGEEKTDRRRIDPSRIHRYRRTGGLPL